MTAHTFSRTAVVKRLLTLIEAHQDRPSGVTVSRGVPRGGATSDLIASGDTFGDETSVPTMRRGRMSYRDQYRVELLCIAYTPGENKFEDADAAAEQLGELVRAVVADHPQLVDVDAEDSPDLCVTSAVLVLADGPSPFHTQDGSASVMRIEVAIDQRID